MLLKSALPLLAFAQAADVYFRIQVDYELLGENDNHQALHTYQKSEKFDHAYDSLGMSMEASAEGFGASGSVAFAMSQMSDDTSSSKNIESLSQNSTTTFQNGRTQVWRVVSKEMSINGNGMTSTDRVYIYDQPADNKYDRSYWDRKAVEYLNLNLLPAGKSTTRNNYVIHEVVSDKPKDDTDIHLLHTIAVDFPVTGYRYTYWWQETYTYSESYVKTVRELSTSASASGGYGGVSASASFAFNTAKSRTSYTSGETKNMNANQKNYPAGQYQVWRRVKETVTINGKSSVVESIDPYDVRYVSGTNNAYSSNEIQSPEYYTKLANEYLKNTLLPADVFDEKVHNQGATVYTKHSVIKGKALTEFFNVKQHWYKSEKYGRFMQCPQGYVATGYCGSGQNSDCGRGKWASIRCTKLSKYSNCDHYYNGYKYGRDGHCHGNRVVTGICGSGRDADCNINRRKYHHANKCCSADNLDIDRSDTIKLYGDHGEFKYCPEGYVLITTCGSGRDADCDRNHTTMTCAKVRPNFASLG